jgi:hypothetical protein
MWHWLTAAQSVPNLSASAEYVKLDADEAKRLVDLVSDSVCVCMGVNALLVLRLKHNCMRRQRRNRWRDGARDRSVFVDSKPNSIFNAPFRGVFRRDKNEYANARGE